MRGTIQSGASHDEMAIHAQTLSAEQKGKGCSSEQGSCKQRGWIINGCYWCGEDCCVNPGWLSAQCHHCGKWYFVSR